MIKLNYIKLHNNIQYTIYNIQYTFFDFFYLGYNRASS